MSTEIPLTVLNPNEETKPSGASAWGPNDNQHPWGRGGAEPPYGVPRLVPKGKGANAKLGDESLAVPSWVQHPTPHPSEEIPITLAACNAKPGAWRGSWCGCSCLSPTQRATWPFLAAAAAGVKEKEPADAKTASSPSSDLNAQRLPGGC